MAAFETYLVEIIVQLPQMCCPFIVGTCLHLANSLVIEGTAMERDLEEWKPNIQTRTAGLSSTVSCNSCAATYDSAASSNVDKTLNSGLTFLTPNKEQDHALGQTLPYKRLSCHISRTPPERLGLGYRNLSFMKRNKHIIRSKRLVKFEVEKAKWCTYPNLLVIYNKSQSHYRNRHSIKAWQNGNAW